MTTEVADCPMCECGEPEDEHYDEVDPPPNLGFVADAADICRNRAVCGCEGFVLDERLATAGGTP